MTVQATERVLPTLNVDGSRRWLRPKPSSGAFLRWRRRVAWLLILVFCAIPYLKVGGKPLVLLDLPRREFTLFGVTFLSTDTVLVMLLALATLTGIFLVTALLGRVWCGWACPQTVYMEFLFRPLERLIEGGWRGSRRLDKGGHFALRRLIKYAVYVIPSVFLAHIFLAYFVGIEQLAVWVQRSPIHHPTSFLVMLGTTAAVYFDFTWFREQTCLVACPYGRLQAVLLDRRSKIVGYDPRRGEPRAKAQTPRPAGAGDCVDCGLCVLTCPTGIDIRQGLQMECIHCTQCMDGCDAVMERFGKPKGLIRYGTQDEFEGRTARFARPRVVLYPIVLAICLATLIVLLVTRSDAEITLLGSPGVPYEVQTGGVVTNQVRIKIRNRGASEHRYRIALDGAPEARVVTPVNPLPVPAGGVRNTSVFVQLPAAAIPTGERVVTFRIDDGAGPARSFPWRLVGPEPARGTP